LLTVINNNKEFVEPLSACRLLKDFSLPRVWLIR